MGNQTTQPTVTQSMPPRQPEMQPPASSKSKLKPLLFSLLFLVVLASAGYGVYSWQHKKVSDDNTKVSSLQSQLTILQTKVNKLSQSTKSSTTTSSTPTATASTAQYTSQASNYSVSYPKGWTTTDCSGVGYIGPTSCESFTSPDFVLQHVSITAGGLFRIISQQANSTSLQYYTSGQGQEQYGTPSSSTSTTVDGIAAERGVNVGAATEIEVYFVNQGKFWEIDYSFSPTQSSANPQYISEFNAFVQSFKFN